MQGVSQWKFLGCGAKNSATRLGVVLATYP